MRIPAKVSKKIVGMVIRSRKTILNDSVMTTSGIGNPSVYHALVVIFLEFFAWGLLTVPIISVLNETFPNHTFLMNGIIMGSKGFLSFLFTPLLGALSDVWGRKFFLLVTVIITCSPIPLMTINSWWFLAMVSISGVAVTFTVVFAYVSDVTEVHERSTSYGLVSAMFAASMIISPALGAYLMQLYGVSTVVTLATAIALLDVFFILVAVPESMSDKVRPNSAWTPAISWEQADPFQSLRTVGKDRTILMLCTAVFFSYLPEAGQYSCIFVYLKLVMGFSMNNVAVFIAVIGILSVFAQMSLGFLMKTLGPKCTIIVGLVFELLQLLWYGFGTQLWMMWAAGILASISSITYPAISAFVSMHSDPDKQGLAQGMVTAMRGLCHGVGPAVFGLIFYMFHVDLSTVTLHNNHSNDNHTSDHSDYLPKYVPGPPFVFGAFLVLCALLVAMFIPDDAMTAGTGLKPTSRRQSGMSVEVHYEIERLTKNGGSLIDSDSAAL